MSNLAKSLLFSLLCLSLTGGGLLFRTAVSHADQPQSATTAIGECLSPEEANLAERINTYRQQNGLPAVPVSRSLVTVAQSHVLDLQTHRPDQGTDQRGLACNMHSWSEHGIWSPVCYTPDHHYASGMWNKPREISGDIYTAPGFENAYRNSGGATAQNAFQAWSNSDAHNDVILNRDNWSDNVFRGMGVGIYGTYAVLWFGEQTDPQGTLSVCPTIAPAALDVNDDGIVSPADAAYVLNRTGSSAPLADVNQDGLVTSDDVQLILDALGTTVTD